MPLNMAFIHGRRFYGPVSVGTVSGSPCMATSECGVAQQDRDAALSAVIDTEGVYNLTVTGATVPGTPIYYTENANPLLRLGIVATGTYFGKARGTLAGPGAAIVAVKVSEASGISALAAGSLEGTAVANVADVNVIGGIPVLFRIDVADQASGNVDVTVTHTIRVVDAWLVKTANASSADANTLTVQSTAAAITNAMSLNAVADQVIVRAGSINDANHRIAGGGILRCAVVRAVAGGQVGCTVYVLAFRIA